MGRTACTEPQCLYKGALYLIFIPQKPVIFNVKNVWSYTSLPPTHLQTFLACSLIKHNCIPIVSLHNFHRNADEPHSGLRAV